MLEYLLFALTGALAGTAAGLLGIGGGMIVVPGLALIFTQAGLPASKIMHVASATSLSAMIFTASMSTFSHNRRKAVLWPVFRQFLPGILIGTFLGILFASYLHSKTLKIIFAIFLVAMAIKMFINFKPKQEGHQLPGGPINFLVSLVIGAKSGLLGIGGGAITIPYLTHSNVSIRDAAGTSAACGLPIAIVGTLSAIITGWHHDPGVASTMGFVYWPATFIVAMFSMSFVFIGARLSSILPVVIIRRIFAILLLLAAFNLVF